MAQRNLLLDLVSEGAMGSSMQPSGSRINSAPLLAPRTADRSDARRSASLQIARALEEERAYSEHIRPLQQVCRCARTPQLHILRVLAATKAMMFDPIVGYSN